MIQPRSALLVVLCLLLMTGSAAFSADQPVTSPRLQAALGDDDYAWRNTDGTLTVWVFFQDKGLEGEALEAALDRAESELSERTAWRRAKVKTRGQRLVDSGDLPVNPEYLNQALATGAQLRRESRWLNAASFKATDAQARELASLASVRKVDMVARFARRVLPATVPAEKRSDASKESNWTIDYGGNLAAMEQAGVPAVHEMGITGQGVIIGMLDSGFHYTHESLAGIPVLGTYDFVNDDTNVDNEAGDPSNAKDHGTMTMSTVMGNMPGQLVAPAFGASVVLAKTEDVAEEVPIEEDQWVAGLEWVETFGVDIVSSSLGYLDWYDWSDMDGATAVTTIAADLAVGRGIVVVNSAGNERGGSWNHIIAPADGDSVITVGAVTSGGDISSFSSPGPSYDGRIKPDVSALGVSNTVANPNDDSAYSTASGTSFSCPLTSGVAALVLSRAPDLTPMQVREALRATASMSDSPNNDFGWGIINAFAAVNYFGPNLVHDPLGDTESIGVPYPVSAVITDRVSLDSATLYFRIDGGSWQDVAMNATGAADTYSADIPGQSAGAVVDYYLSAASSNGVQTQLPSFAPDDFFTFRVGPDLTLPLLAHIPLSDQAMIVWPPLVSCTASDNLGLDRVEMSYILNGGELQGPFLLNADGGQNYSLVFPLTSAEVQIGDAISYTITAYDLAGTPNSTASGPHDFSIIDALGVVLVLEDAPSTKTDLKYGPEKEIINARDGGKSSAGTIAGWLIDAGYVADIIPADSATVADFQGYQAVVLSAGDNAVPVETEGIRQALQDWVAAGGKLLLEGGELGYDVLSNPGYPDFASQVLHATGWDADSSGDLLTVSGQENHALLNNPHTIDAMIDVVYEGYGDQDAVEIAADAYAVMLPSSHTDDAGILVYDDNPAPQSAQVVYFTFNVEAVAALTGQHLVLNALHYLLAEEAAPTSSLSGAVTLGGQSDHSGVLVTTNGGQSTVTAADGSWSITDLYGALYTLTFSKEAWGSMVLNVNLEDNQQLTGLNVQLTPVMQMDYSLEPGVAIPDNTPAGISSVIVVPEGEAGTLSGVTLDVDITHSWIGDLTIQLVGPGGQVINLHNRSGSSSDDIVGTYPTTLVVEGPGSLDDFIGTNNAGAWVLAIADHVGSDTGTLNSWGLHFLIPAPVSTVDGSQLPAVTRLNPNVPNPFNPMTKISFDLSRSGPVRLGIYDVRGLLVRQLVSENLTAGSHTVRWNGTDDGGRSVSSGVYLYRLESPTGVQERKMVLVR